MPKATIIEVYEKPRNHIKRAVAHVSQRELDKIRLFILINGGSEEKSPKNTFKVDAPCLMPFVRELERKLPNVKFVVVLDWI